jgi:hypothetical protein
LIAGEFLPGRTEILAHLGHRAVSVGIGWEFMAKIMTGDLCRVRLVMMAFRLIVRFVPGLAERSR